MKELRTQVLKRIVRHRIAGGEANQLRADRLMESLITAMGSAIVQEVNYSADGDPMFGARRELQRELEDDLAADAPESEMDPEAGEEDPMQVEPVDADADTSADAVGEMIAALIKSSDLDPAALEQIVSIIAGNDELETSPTDGELDGEVDPEAGEVDPEAGEEMGEVEPELDPEVTLPQA